MQYRRALDYLLSLQKFGIKFGLSSTENLLAGLGRPQDGLAILHLAGTNGKGSVGAAVTSILRRAGYTVGFYTSPHLVTFRERMVIGRRDGLEMIGAADVVRLVERIKSVSAPQEPPTFFEFVTAMAFLYFAERKVDLAVMETGMGGRLDATNVARPLVGVITNISIEHTDYLGPTLAHIAREKAGIIKPGLTVLTAERRASVRAIFEEKAGEVGARLLALGRDFRVRSRPGGGFDYHGLAARLRHLSINLVGPHQHRNAALALAAVELLSGLGFPVAERDLRAGLSKVHWPGRAETFAQPDGGPILMLDGAHNPDAARVLARTLDGLDYRDLHLILGIMADKDIAGIMAPLLSRARVLYLTRPAYFRAAPAETLARAAAGFSGPQSLYETVPAAIEAARTSAGPGDLILVTGSLFTVGEARAYLTGEPGD
ncbi:MAG: folylpolyglutamate synthase/dihydrofolate synthase family protein [Thermodesulfobacteriota bacterium]